MNSSWETSKLKSNYHFHDQFIIDPEYDTVIYLGNIQPTWQEDLNDIIAQAKPATWATRGYKAEGVQGPSDELASEEYDLTRHGMSKDLPITHLNWQIPESLRDISKKFALSDCMERIHVQQPGEVWNLHLDKLQKWNPENPDSVIRIMIQLTDWQPGQFWEYGNFHYNKWHAGDITTFDWHNVPHSTANAGHHPRVTFQITGVATDKTREYIKLLRSQIE